MDKKNIAVATIGPLLFALGILCQCGSDNSASPGTPTFEIYKGVIPGDTVSMHGLTLTHNFFCKIISDNSYISYDTIVITNPPGYPKTYRKASQGSWQKSATEYTFAPDSCLGADQSYSPANCPASSSVGVISGDSVVFSNFPVFGRLVVVKLP